MVDRCYLQPGLNRLREAKFCVVQSERKHLKTPAITIQFSSVQSLSRVWLFATTWTAVCQASLSITNSRSPAKPISIESVMPSNHFILCQSSVAYWAPTDLGSSSFRVLSFCLLILFTMSMPFICLGFTSEIHFSLWAGLLFSLVQSLALEGDFMRRIVATRHGEGWEHRQRGQGPALENGGPGLCVTALQAEVLHHHSSDSPQGSGGPVSLQEWKEQDWDWDIQGPAGTLLRAYTSPITSLCFHFLN